MAGMKRKPPVKETNRATARPGRRRARRGLVVFVLVTVAVIAAAAVVYWKWTTISGWGRGVGNSVLTSVGFGGLILLLVALLAVVLGFWWSLVSDSHRQRVRTRLRFMRRGLGMISLLAVVWGILAFLNLGGSFGNVIIGSASVIGGLRLAGMTLLGVVLIAPQATARGAVILLSGIGSFFAWFKPRPRQPRPVKPAPAQSPETGSQTNIFTQPPEPVMPTPVPTSTRRPPMVAPKEIPNLLDILKDKSRAALDAKDGIKAAFTDRPKSPPAEAKQSSPGDLRQVAQDVWRKYGEDAGNFCAGGWRLPPLDILDLISEAEISKADNLNRAKTIEEALGSYGVDAKVVQINVGPTVTQFGIEPGWVRKFREVKERDDDGNVTVRQEEVSRTRVKVERITSLANDLALILAAPSIRIEAPVPGKPMVGIEVPNSILGMVSMRAVLETPAFSKLNQKSKLAIGLGKGAGGEAVAGDLTKMPHLLIAGATGSGKTVCMNTIITCLLLYNTPDELRFVMIDPKRVELTPFNGIPHLQTPVIVDTSKAISAMRWLSQEMDKRYKTMASIGVRNVEAYNKSRADDEKLPYLLLVIDELADLMMTTSSDEVEQTICRLAQLGRAAGIHLIIATQRPSVDVVTGLIKANFPTRISFAVTSQVDSRTILDIGGAEKLLGRGDMLYLPTDAAKPKRLQGSYVSDAETERLVFFWGNQRLEERAAEKPAELVPEVAVPQPGDYPDDSLLDAARQIKEEHHQISASFLQRRLHIGYPRAARIMEQLEEEDVGGSAEPETPEDQLL